MFNFGPESPKEEEKIPQPPQAERFALDESIIQNIVAGKWEDVLVKLTQDMDPWDIDLIKLNKRFTAHIKQAFSIDLKIPAKILLTAAIIYRMKAESMLYVEEEEAAEVLPSDGAHPLKGVKIPPLQMPLRREPRRKVSLFELIVALDKAFLIKDKREARQVLTIDLDGIADGRDISEHIEELYKKIAAFLEKEGVLTFSALTGSKGRDDRLTSFTCLLHLVHQERVAAWQKALFDEIYIKKVNGESASEERE